MLERLKGARPDQTEAEDRKRDEAKVDASLPPAQLKRRRYMNMALLIVDELGFEPMTR